VRPFSSKVENPNVGKLFWGVRGKSEANGKRAGLARDRDQENIRGNISAWFDNSDATETPPQAYNQLRQPNYYFNVTKGPNLSQQNLLLPKIFSRP
jgi:hypothetical protein